MADTEKSQLFYLRLGKVVWFILRWLFYIFLFYFFFLLGTKQGNIPQRVKQLRPPRIYIVLPHQIAAAPEPSSPPAVDAYVVLLGSFNDLGASKSFQARASEARINSYIVTNNGRFHVCVGKYKSEKSANRVLKQVQARGFSGATVVAPSQLAANLP